MHCFHILARLWSLCDSVRVCPPSWVLTPAWPCRQSPTHDRLTLDLRVQRWKVSKATEKRVTGWKDTVEKERNVLRNILRGLAGMYCVVNFCFVGKLCLLRNPVHYKHNVIHLCMKYGRDNPRLGVLLSKQEARLGAKDKVQYTLYLFIVYNVYFLYNAHLSPLELGLAVV